MAMPDQKAGPRFSIVTAVYDVGRFLPDFVRSIDAQGMPPNLLEVVAVDDGSTDESLRLLRDWAARSEYRVTVLTKPNGGQGSARNMGLEHARGDWVTFTDPDDVLDDQYLRVVDAFLAAHPDSQMIATNRIFFDDEPTVLRNEHPLRAHFAAGNRLVDLDRCPEYFHGSAPAAFFRLDQIQRDRLRFDTRVRPNFEDGHFCTNFLLGAPTRLVGFVADARYLYRKRSDLSSTLQTSLTDPRRYTQVPEFGYLDVLTRAVERFGSAPEWLQNLIIYELSWYLSAEEAPSGSPSAAFGDAAEAFHRAMPRILAFLDPQAIQSFNARYINPAWRDMLLHAWADQDWCSAFVVSDRLDETLGLARVVHRYIGDRPVVEYLVDGVPTPPRHAKIRNLDYLDRTLMHERIAWVSCRGTLRVRVNGELVPIRRWWDGPLPLYRDFQAPPPTTTSAPELARKAARRVARTALQGSGQAVVTGPGREFRGAWVLVDRVHDADDSAEVLFRHLRAHRPDINAWFTIERNTPDWHRMRRDGYGDRLVGWGGVRWRALMANCSYLISSHIDAAIHRPQEILRWVEPRWRFVFLQHGIIKDDLSNWLNTKELALFVTSTAAEYASVAGDGTRYMFTTKEVCNTGLPRFDRLLDVGAQYPPERRDLVVVAPTWRHWLTPPLVEGSQRRTVIPDFWETDYARNWMGLLRSDRLAKAVQAEGLRLAFLPHPNLQSVLDSADLPAHVMRLRFAGQDVRSFFARAAAVTTDYSSMAFNAAYLERPVTYFQFDADRMFGGGHVGRGGYFKYDRDGLGPVAHDLDTAIDDLVGVLAHGRRPQPEYLDRIRATFPQRDGRACERVAAAIEALGRPLTDAELGTPIPTPMSSGQ